MTKEEFESLSLMKVTEEEYQEIDFLYMQAENMIKRDFCRDFVAYGASDIIKELSSTLKRYISENESYRERTKEAAYKLIGSDTGLNDIAAKLVGFEEYIKIKLEKGVSLTKSESTHIIDLLNGRKVL